MKNRVLGQSKEGEGEEEEDRFDLTGPNGNRCLDGKGGANAQSSSLFHRWNGNQHGPTIRYFVYSHRRASHDTAKAKGRPSGVFRASILYGRT